MKNLTQNDSYVKNILLGKNGKNSLLEETTSILTFRKNSKPIIFIGSATCGIVAGSLETKLTLIEYLKERQIDAEVVEIGCSCPCSFEPIVEVKLPGKNRISFKNITSDKVEAVLDGLFNNDLQFNNVIGQYFDELHHPWENVINISDLPFFSAQKRILLKNSGLYTPENILQYVATGGYKSFAKCITQYKPQDICNIVEESQLEGRGGGGYQTGRKWNAALQIAAGQKYLICNANESDTGSFIVRRLIENHPHLLIEGIAIASFAIGASKAYVFNRNDYNKAIEVLSKALQQAKEYELIGSNILNSGTNFSIVLVQSAGAFVCGEETALINSIAGKRGMPSAKPPFPVESGLFDFPTVVNSAETLCNIPSIILNGPDWFKSFGKLNSFGTKLISIAGKTKTTGFAEIEMGVSITEVLENIAGFESQEEIKALQIGGPNGSCIPPSLFSIPIDYQLMKDKEIRMGSGGIVLFDDTTCMVDLAKHYMKFIKNESCGKCIPCREGTRKMFEILENITISQKNEGGHETLDRFKGVMQIESLANVISDTSLCGLGKYSPNPFLSTLKWFRSEYEEHIFDRKCKAGVCQHLKSYYIHVEKCTGCNACAVRCPANAILGNKLQPHFILQELCTSCGICFEICKFSSISIQ